MLQTRNLQSSNVKMDKMFIKSIPVRFVLTVALTIVAVTHISAVPLQKTSQAEIYLSQFGYLPASARNPSSDGLIDESTWNKAIVDFQQFAGLNATGDLDDETMEYMALPRCGVRDKVGFGSDARAKRYALQGSRWKVKALTYRISKYPSRLEKGEVDKEVAKAFSVWTTYTDLTFTPKKKPVHIEIRFETGQHGDGDPFDGPGGTLAHAFFPVYGGDAHFDDSEVWTIGSNRGTNLFQVAAHEFGHSLGLSHSDVRSALMAPFYRGYQPSFKLDSDDIQGIQALYGRKTTGLGQGGAIAPRPTIRPRAPNPDNEICTDPKIDAIFNTADGNTYAFKNDKYYRLTENAIAEGYPKQISDGWPGLPSNIDAAFTYKNGKTYFFRGDEYWRYNDRQVDGEYPKKISEGFTGVPDNLDSAFVWGGNGKIYFYKGSKFWRFDPLKRPPVSVKYPKLISNWEGVPDNVDAALQYTNGYTYFFVGDKYYRFNDRTFSVDQASPAFPRPTAHWWFGCKTDNKGNVIEAEGSHYESDNDVDGQIVLEAGGTDERPYDERKDDNNFGLSYHQTTSTILLATTLLVSTIIKLITC